MAISYNLNWATRMANNWDSQFNEFGVYQLYSDARAFPADQYTIGSNDATNRLVYSTDQYGFIVSGGELIFNPANPPAPTVASASGTASWILLHTLNFGGSFAGSVSLAGGDGLVHISNDGSGGGSGLNIQAGDVISVVGFRLKWG